MDVSAHQAHLQTSDLHTSIINGVIGYVELDNIWRVIMSKIVLHTSTICVGAAIGYLIIPTIHVFGAVLLTIIIYAHLASMDTPIQISSGAGNNVSFLALRLAIYIGAFIGMNAQGTELFIIACLFSILGVVSGVISHYTKRALLRYLRHLEEETKEAEESLTHSQPMV